MIEITGVSKSYGNGPVLEDINLELPRGGITTLIGPNGAGKSTLLAIMSRLLAPDQGTVLIDGQDVFATSSDQIARVLAVLRQENHMTARLTVRELVEFGRYPYSKGRLSVADRALVDRSMDFFDLGSLANRSLHQLSGGQRQRAFVAMVLCQDTDYILLDEPLNNLDMRHASEIMGMLGRVVAEQAKTVLMVLHDLNYACTHSERVVALKEGRVCHDGPTESLMEPQRLRAVYDMDIAVHTVGDKKLGVYY